MTEDTVTETPANDEHKAVESVVDAHTNETVPAPAPAEAETQKLIEPVAEAPVEVPVEAAAVAEPAPEAAVAAVLEEPIAAPADSEPVEVPAPKPKKSKAPKAAPVVAAEPVATEPAVTEAAAEPTSSVAPTEEPVEEKPENKKKWYAIKVQSGREDTIKAAILRKVAIEGLEDVFGQIMIPFEEVIEKKTVKVKDKKTGEYTTQEKKVVRKKKKFQGYLFAELEFNDRILYLFRETSGVGDFLNLRGTPPVPEPMPEHEVKQMLTGEKVGPAGGSKKVKLEFEKGDRVRIREGSFANSEGEVKSITEPKDPTDAPKITVVVTFWGRPLDVELEYWQVAKV